MLQTKKQFAKETTEIRNKIDEEQRARVAADQDLKRELEESGAGNLHVEAASFPGSQIASFPAAAPPVA